MLLCRQLNVEEKQFSESTVDTKYFHFEKQ